MQNGNGQNQIKNGNNFNIIFNSKKSSRKYWSL
jgi:hypothetical protein